MSADDLDSALEQTDGSWLLLRSSTVNLAFLTAHVREICPLPQVFPLPSVPPYVAGLMNWRGAPIPLVHLDTVLDLPRQGGHGRPNLHDDSEEGRRKRVAVLAVNDLEAALICDAMYGVEQIALSAQQAPGTLDSGRVADYAVAEVETERGRFALLHADRLLRALRVGT